jgi:single-strand DNA-binding protein
MATLNKVTLIGNLGSNPEIKTGSNEKPFAVLSLATHDNRKDKDGNKVTYTEWHHALVFNEQAVTFASQYLRKGDLVYVEGQLRTFEQTNEEGQIVRNLRVVIPRYEGQLMALNQAKKDQSQTQEQA